MKKILLIISILLLSFHLKSQTYIAEDSKITGVWTKENSPYIIEGEVSVPLGGVLTINAGTKIHLKAKKHRKNKDMERGKGYGTILVYGNIRALGTKSSPIIFTKSIDKGQWGSVYLFESDYSEFNYCNFEHSGGQINIIGKRKDAFGAISLYKSSPKISNVKISNCSMGIYSSLDSSPIISNTLIEYCKSYGIYLQKNSNILITNSVISSSNRGIYCDSSNLTMNKCNVLDNEKYGFSYDEESNVKINRCIILGNGFAFDKYIVEDISQTIIQLEIDKKINPINTKKTNYLSKTNLDNIHLLQSQNIVGLKNDNTDLFGKIAMNKFSHHTINLNGEAIVVGSQIIENKEIDSKPLIREDKPLVTENIPAKIIEKRKVEIIKSDVDINIPNNGKNNNYRFALIIGNEDYNKFQTNLSSEVDVDFAINDAEVFAQYCKNTLGVPEENIFLLKNAIGTEIKREVSKISKVMMYTQGKAEVIFYYAGHGIPHETTKESYIMPVDVSAQHIEDGIKLSWLYSKLVEYDSKYVLVFLDACFSGGARNQGLLAARGVKIKPNKTIINGNCVAFTSSSGIQSSLPYKKKQHGMFTYYLLKKLQESKGNITLGELSNYLYSNVGLSSLRVNSKEQTPKTLVSPSLNDSWEQIKLVE